MEIRQATLQDLPFILAIYLRVTYSAAPPSNEYLTKLITKGGLFVAEDRCELIGFGGVDLEAAEQIKYLYVIPEHQHQGVGSKLLRELEGLASMTGLSGLRLHSSPGAVDFYKAKGYEPVSESDIAHDHEGFAMMKGTGLTIQQYPITEF